MRFLLLLATICLAGACSREEAPTFALQAVQTLEPASLQGSALTPATHPTDFGEGVSVTGWLFGLFSAPKQKKRHCPPGAPCIKEDRFDIAPPERPIFIDPFNQPEMKKVLPKHK